MFIRAYLRASTETQDASRARADLDSFAKERGLRIASYHVENESGAKLDRPQLFALLSQCQPGDILLVEQVDRLSRLTAPDWDSLKTQLHARQTRVVSLDLPTSWKQLEEPSGSEGEQAFQRSLLAAINSMLLDMLAAIARKDYEDRRRRVAQGIVKAKAAGKYRGKPADTQRNADLLAMLNRGMSWSEVCRTTGASRSTLARLVKQAAEPAHVG